MLILINHHTSMASTLASSQLHLGTTLRCHRWRLSLCGVPSFRHEPFWSPIYTKSEWFRFHPIPRMTIVCTPFGWFQSIFECNEIHIYICSVMWDPQKLNHPRIFRHCITVGSCKALSVWLVNIHVHSYINIQIHIHIQVHMFIKIHLDIHINRQRQQQHQL